LKIDHQVPHTRSGDWATYVGVLIVVAVAATVTSVGSPRASLPSRLAVDETVQECAIADAELWANRPAQEKSATSGRWSLSLLSNTRSW
jgi:hypothetical protein